MVPKLPEGEKRLFWAFKCDIFDLFCKFSRDELETIFMESKSEPPKWFHFKLFQGKDFRNWLCSFFEVKQERSERLNMEFFILKMFLRKARQSTENCGNPKLDVETFSGFETTWRSKADVLNVWKWQFLVFYKYLSDGVETTYCESKAK